MYACVFSLLYIFIFPFVFYIFYVFSFNFSVVCVGGCVLLCEWLNVCVWSRVGVCMVFLCACVLSYLLWQVSHERRGMLFLKIGIHFIQG